MFIEQLTTADAIPTLTAAAQFAAGRQKLIASNIANLDTPGYITKDVSPEAFQAQLASAVDRRRAKYGGSRGELEIESSGEVAVAKGSGPIGGTLELHPKTPSGNILFHDRNERDLDRSMQALAENVAMFRVATDLLRSRISLLETALRERI